VESYFDYWGKAQFEDGPGECHLLAFHSLDVAAVGAELLARDPVLLDRASNLSGFSRDSLERVLPYHLALHDLGKFAETFQDLRPGLVKQLQGESRPERAYGIRHDSLGYLLWRQWTKPNPLPEETGLLSELFPLVLPSRAAGRRDVDEAMQSWMAAVLGHHGKPPEECRLPAAIFAAQPGQIARSRQDAASFARAARVLLGPGELASEVDDVDALLARVKRASWWLAGFTILCDWMGSDTSHFHYEPSPRPLADYWRDARAAAAKAVQSSGLAGSRPRPFGGIGALFPKIVAEPSPLQIAAAKVELGEGPRLFVLEDLTGSGKTEAALILAHRLMAAGRGSGLYFALPTMATADAMHHRVWPLVGKLFEGKPSYLLTHSGPRLDEKDWIAIGRTGPGGGDPDGGRGAAYGRDEQETASSAASAWLSDNRKKALLAELGVGTIDQALLAALQSKHAAVRLFGLHRHVLIVDEVHACDTYMLGILRKLLELHAAFGGSAILLSATLPLEQRCMLTAAFCKGLGQGLGSLPESMDYPLLTGCGAGPTVEQPVAPRRECPRTIPITWHATTDAAAARVVEAARAGLCACWIRNSVKDAVEAYAKVVATLGREKVTLFHARFALGDRLHIGQLVVDQFGAAGDGSRRAGHVVIATQVVEQSLDIDFDVMVTDLCPIDLLIQRAGRLQRHAKRDLGRPAAVLEVLAPPWSETPPPGWLGGIFRRTALVYDDPGVLWRTVREISRRGKLALPADARSLVEAVYGADSAEVPDSLVSRANAALGASMAHASIAQNAVLKLDRGYLREGSDWSDEQYTPTRLGEPSTTVRLARVGPDGAAAAWREDLGVKLQWPLSQVSMARRLVAKAASGDEAIREELAAKQPFVGDDTVTVLLREESPGRWTGKALAERLQGGVLRDMSVRISYSPELGLEVDQGA
jgi:CRISPR-associated endonuclease/helicase Cas3